MKATLKGKVIAESDDIVENDGYFYFPPEDVRTDWLEKAPVTDKDRTCPHGVQFYDVLIDGVRHPRNAWVYESPRSSKAATQGRVGFWQDVEVG